MDRIISVKGTGKISVSPDYIEVLLSISSQNMEYGEALELANDKVEKLQNAVKAAGFCKKDLKTTNFRVNTVHNNVRDENGEYHQKFAGYNCRYDMKLSFDFDTEILAKALGEIANFGAQPELNIQFTVKNPDAVRKELLESAAENARQKAEILCKASGVKLGELVNINYNWAECAFVSPTQYDVSAAAMPLMAKRVAAPAIVPEDIQVSDSAAFRWAIQ
ncbi:MAG: SIMPL domain-containing protein [Faecousia sp.]